MIRVPTGEETMKRSRGSILAAVACLSVVMLGEAAAVGGDEIENKPEDSGVQKVDSSVADKPLEQPKAKTDETPAAKIGDKKDPTMPAEVLSFRQEKVAAEMTELEERMFRLSEALKALEPENSSRLMLGLKFAREELILHQMKEAQKHAGQTESGRGRRRRKSVAGQTPAAARSRCSRPTSTSRCNWKSFAPFVKFSVSSIKRSEEDREQKLSAETAEKEKELEWLRKKRATLEELIQRETASTSSKGASWPKGRRARRDDQQVVGKLVRRARDDPGRHQGAGRRTGQGGKEPSAETRTWRSRIENGPGGEKLA